MHWLTVAAVAAQFAVGYNLDLDERDCDPPGEELSGGDTTDAFEDRLDRLEDACEARAGDYDMVGGGFDLAELHLALGLTGAGPRRAATAAPQGRRAAALVGAPLGRSAAARRPHREVADAAPRRGPAVGHRC